MSERVNLPVAPQARRPHEDAMRLGALVSRVTEASAEAGRIAWTGDITVTVGALRL